jgi:hypothetical protein
MAFPCAGENALFRAQSSCLKVPPSDERIACIKKENETASAFEKEYRQTQGKESGDTKKKDLCFTRKATGEVVCPN